MKRISCCFVDVCPAIPEVLCPGGEGAGRAESKTKMFNHWIFVKLSLKLIFYV